MIKNVIFNNTIKLFIFFCYFEFSNVFEKKNLNKFLEHDFDDYVIKIFSKNFFLINFIYNLSRIELEMLRKYINENLKKKFIKFFKFSTKSFILFIKKSNDNLRLCVNYRKLNVITIKNRFFFKIKILINFRKFEYSQNWMFKTFFTKFVLKTKMNEKRFSNVDLNIINTELCFLNW